MNTKLLMSASAVASGIAGGILLFLPQEVATWLNHSKSTIESTISIQLLGAAYFSLSMNQLDGASQSDWGNLQPTYSDGKLHAIWHRSYFIR